MACVEDKKDWCPEGCGKLRGAAAAAMRAVEESHHALDDEHVAWPLRSQPADQRLRHRMTVEIHRRRPACRREKGTVDIVGSGFGGADVLTLVRERAKQAERHRRFPASRCQPADDERA